MANETEPRALGAALAAPAFVTRGHGVAMHAADRHVERWAPEVGAGRVGSMRSLGFVDRLVAPWIETAQRSASLRLLHQYAHTGLGEREGGAVSWLFPRPWYQDELDWMAAARRVGSETEAKTETKTDEARRSAPSLLTTRGTYVAPARAAGAAAPPVVMPSALYEYVAPSLSIAARRPVPIPGVGFGRDALSRTEAYSPLVPLAAVQAAELMTRTVAPLAAPRGPAATVMAMTPALRTVLTSVLARAAAADRRPAEPPPARISTLAPELVTPPAPRPEDGVPAAAVPAGEPSAAPESAMQVAEQYAAQRARVAELERIAQQAIQRELAARAASAAAPAADRGVAVSEQGAARATTQAGPAAAPAATDELRAAAGRAAEAQRQADAKGTAERARIEERVAQRIAERATAQRLHEQARAEAAAHAGAAVEAARGPASLPGTAAAAAPGDAQAQPPRAPAEVAAAIAGLPPELAAVLAPVVAQRPDRAMRAIHELNETLRAVELIARSSAAGTVLEVTRGPRLVMPAGLGGLVSAVERAQSITEQRAMLGGRRLLAPLPQLVAPEAQELAVRGAGGAPASEARVPAMPWLSAEPRRHPIAPMAPGAIAPTSALGATASAAPAALSHVAWADRWLARFAGAGAQSLDAISAAGAAAPATRMQALLQAAPGAVFVAPDARPDLLRGDLTATADDALRGRSAAVPSASAMPLASAWPASASPGAAAELAGMRRIDPSSEPILRFDDEAETPDDVFAAIAAAASRGRVSASRAAAAPPPAAVSAAPADVPAADRPVLADLLARSAPSAPDVGLSAQLASSPFAPALRHILSLPSVVSFDVRSLFGADLGATYLAGLIDQAPRELTIGTQAVPTWASWSESPLVVPSADRIDRIVPGFDAAYVSPEAVSARDLPEPEATGASPVSAEALTTLRTALLSWEPGAPGAAQLTAARLATAPGLSLPSPGDAAFASAAQSAGAARRMIEAISLPMLGEAGPDPSSTWAAPGMLAERAHSWSVAQERSAADLALDFVAPELVLAARVYGLGPAEAAQAARLAIAGPGQLGAMASTVDRTFVEALAIGRAALPGAERYQRIASAAEAARAAGEPSGHPAGAPSGPGTTAGAPAMPIGGRAAIATAFPMSGGAVAAVLGPAGSAQPPRSAAFGVDRRAPRGAFLWPSAAVAALGMNAASPDGELAMSVAALELLAAQVVAEIGTYTALSGADAVALGLAGGAGPDSEARWTESDRSAPPRLAALSSAVSGTGSGTTSPTAPAGAGRAASSAEPAEADVLGAAAVLVPSSRRARFEALYVALSQSAAGLHGSPAARAARALALAGRGEDAPLSARERAATAWDVLPVVYASDSGASAAAGAGPASSADPAVASASAAVAQAMATHVAPSWLGGPRASGSAAPARRGAGGLRARVGAEARDVVAAGSGDLGSPEGPAYVAGPGLGALSARAGEALGSYVTPVAPPAAPRERPSDTTSVGAVLRPPTAAPEYVHTGRSGGRYGGGEVEIPPWFEAAARKMLAARTGDADGISLAELTLVTAAPASHVAASSRSQTSTSLAATHDSGPASTQAANTPKIDIEKLAGEIYRDILGMMDVARARNGDPYQ